MSEGFWLSVLVAVVVTGGSVLVTWLVALLFVKVVKWPSEHRNKRVERMLIRTPHTERGADPQFLGLSAGMVSAILIGIAVTVPFSSESGATHEGRVVAAHSCTRDPLALWWLYECKLAVAMNQLTVKGGRGHVDPPDGTVDISVHSRQPVEAGQEVGWKARVDWQTRTATETYFFLLAEQHRPTGTWGVVIGVVVGTVIAWFIGGWWQRSRPQPFGGRYLPTPDPDRLP